MNELRLIIDQLKTTFDGRAFHGPSLMEALRGIDVEEARGRPIWGRHTIWEIVNHCAYWMDAVAGALRREVMPRYDPESPSDWPPMGETEGEWRTAVERLRRAHGELVGSLARFDVSHLGDVVPGRSYTYRMMLHGISDHNLYHAGQIAVFRKKR